MDRVQQEIERITIFLSPEEVEKYKLFCQYYKNFDFMLKCNAFETKNSAIMLHFDQNGVIQNVWLSKKLSPT